jgi:hypothetical protein
MIAVLIVLIFVSLVLCIMFLGLCYLRRKYVAVGGGQSKERHGRYYMVEQRKFGRPL